MHVEIGIVEKVQVEGAAAAWQLRIQHLFLSASVIQFMVADQPA
jgi:hypothetical protein